MKTYDWKRYWHKQNESPLIINGFLIVHEYTQNIFTLDSVSAVPCIVLLGEPGMGKSKEIERIYESQIPDDKNDKLRFNLSSTGEEKIIRQSIFESDKINKWKQNDSNLYLFLDSLDEALLNINTLAILLAEELEKLPIERLYLRIACRTAEWSNLSILENKLRYIWKDDKCQILQIAPLQQTNVENTAQTENLDSQKFIAEIFNKNVSVLAAKPVTLRFLVELFRKNNSFPSTQTELYKQGCLTLCEERSETRIASKRIGKLNSEKRLVIAARIAALMVFGNKSSIWIGKTIGQEDSDLLLSELYGYLETVKGIEFKITEEHIKEVVFDTGLFTGNGENRSKFSHQTFAEFLASWYLEYRKVPDGTIIEIIGETYLYPQLYETSAWIANQRQNMFEHLMKIAPTTLLRSDILLADNSTKTKLVSILLDLFDKEKSEGIDRSYYRKLNHPNLAEQIKPYIIDKTKGWLVRTEALDILQMCEIKGLQNELLEIVFDRADNFDFRVRAAYAIDRVGDIETKVKLKPLVFGKEEDDERFRLKGAALGMLWNEHITAKELFSVMSRPNHYFTGSYERFLSYEMTQKLKPKDLPIALDWLSENIEDFGYLDFAEKRVADEILLKAWENLEDEEVFEGFIMVLAKLFHEVHYLFKEIRDEEKLNQILQENNKRRKVWLKLFTLTDIKDFWWIEHSQFIALRNNDINWLAKEWRKTVDVDLKAKLLMKLKSFISYWGTHPDALDGIHKACEENVNLKKEFEPSFAPIELGSDAAKQQKELFKEHNKWKEKDKKREEEWNKPIYPSPMESTLESLNKFESGEISAFLDVCYFLMFFPNGRSESGDFESDLTKFPVWKDIDENTKLRIIKAAKIYLEKGNPENEKWVGTKNFQYSALYGYKALVLIEKFESKFIETLPKSIWGKWSAIIYYHPIYDEYEKRQQLIAKIYKIVPEKFIELFKQELENKSEDNYWSFEKLKFCWDEILKNVLKEKLKDNTLSVLMTKKILSQLFELKDNETEKIVCDFVKFPIPENTKEKELLIMAVSLLISNGKTKCWDKIWNILKKDLNLSSTIIQNICVGIGVVNNLQDLSEKQLADLYLWLSEKYPHKEDLVHHGSYSPSFRDNVKDWRESVLNTLLEKGTAESVNEIKRIKDNLIEIEWLNRAVLRAEEKRRITSWKPVLPENLLQLFMNVENKVAEKTKNEQADISELVFEQKPVSENLYLEDLLRLYQKNPDGIAFFVGAGLSMPLFPSWQKLLTDMVDLCEKNTPVTKKDAKNYKGKIKKGEDYLGIASACEKALGKTEYNRFLQKQIDKEISFDYIPANYKELINLKPKIIVTTNFDKIPETLITENNKFEVCNNQHISHCERYNKESRPFILKLHGCISSMNSIVFTNDDFDQIIHNKPDVKIFMQSLLSTKTFVFIGFSFEDPNIENMFSFLKSIGLNTNPHYALIIGMDNFKKRAKENAFGIRIIPYSSLDKSHKEVGEFINLFSKLK
jgi:SIR2-like domain